MRFEAVSNRIRKSSEQRVSHNKIIVAKKEAVEFDKLKSDLDRVKGAQVTTIMQNLYPGANSNRGKLIRNQLGKKSIISSQLNIQ